MKCAYHPEHDAVTRCARCQTPLCGECSAGRKTASVLCPRCEALTAAGDLVESVSQRKEQHRVRKSARQERVRRKARYWRWGLWGALLVSIAVMTFHIGNWLSEDASNRPLRAGTYQTDRQADQCIERLWRVAARLQQDRQPGPGTVCPATGKPYIVSDEKGDWVARCPNPKAHGVQAIRIRKGHPVPEVIP